MKKFRNKLFPTLISLVISFSAFADDLKVADDFKEGDILSAETFNQIFDTLETINRTVKEDDIFGTWTCSSIASRLTPPTSEVNGWEKKGFLWELSSSQVNFNTPITISGTTQSQSSENTIEYPANVSTSSPSPFFVINSSSSGTYSVYNGMLFIKGVSGSNPGIVDENWVDVYEIDLISSDRLSLTNKYSTTTGIPKYLICDISEAVPASPTGPTAVNAKTSIDLAWTDASDNETGFKIYRKPDGSEEFTLLTTLTTSSYSDTVTTEGVGYSYYVVSYNDKGESAKSKVVSAILDSILPTVISTNPADGTNSSGTTVSITFSEAIEIKCPADMIMPQGGCNDGPAIKVQGTGGSGNTYYMGQVGEKGIIFTANPFVDGANPNYDVTISKDFIFDFAGNQMAEDYTFSFTDQ